MIRRSFLSDISIAGREGPPGRRLLLLAPHISLAQKLLNF